MFQNRFVLSQYILLVNMRFRYFLFSEIWHFCKNIFFFSQQEKKANYTNKSNPKLQAILLITSCLWRIQNVDSLIPTPISTNNYLTYCIKLSSCSHNIPDNYFLQPKNKKIIFWENRKFWMFQIDRFKITFFSC